MPKITYRTAGDEITVDATLGVSIMQTALTNDIDGIVAECGGNAMCATCHVYVEDGPVDRLPAVSVAEEEMLESTAAPREDNSRLSCQLPVTSEIDGLVVKVAEEQL